MFATDAILATLMTSPCSAYSWDIIVQVSTVYSGKEFNLLGV